MGFSLHVGFTDCKHDLPYIFYGQTGQERTKAVPTQTRATLDMQLTYLTLLPHAVVSLRHNGRGLLFY